MNAPSGGTSAYVVLTIAMYLAREISIWLSLALAVPTAGFLLRTFIVFHDCAHGSFGVEGSSYLRLPKVLQFFSGNIGLHHVRHLSAKVPNYNVQRAHDEIPLFADVPVPTFTDGVRAVRPKLIDPSGGRLVTWRQARRLASV